MPNNTPSREFVPIKFGGPMQQAQTPNAVGSDGLTACNNLTYRRFGAWGKRPGYTAAYTFSTGGPYPSAPSSATRFYQAYYDGNPQALTKTVIAAQGALWAANDVGATPAHLIDFTAANAQPVGFCEARDPAASGGNGSDILIIAGGSLANGTFATGAFNFFGNPIAGQVITLTLTPVSGPAVTVTYTTLATDNQSSVATEMSNLINISAAVAPGTPFIAQTFATKTILAVSGQYASTQVGALVGGSAGNGIGISGSITGTGGVRLVITAPAHPAATNLAGGGATLYGPLKYDGNTVTGLSPFITNAFTGCVTWHNHVWFWGDPNNPQTVFATDINEPEGFSFMLTEGGYDIGDGTGAQAVTALVPAGNILYAFNTGSSYAITGYDFQTGEYQFAIAPAIADSGVAYKECVTTLRNAIIYWDGTEFQKLVPGSFETERLGAPIPFSQGLVTTGTQSVIRAVAGKFVVQSTFGIKYFGTGGPTSSPTILSNVALFAVAEGGSTASSILVYDEDASRLMGFPAWSRWTGWSIGSWLTFGSGHNSAGTSDDTPTLFFMPPTQLEYYQVGGSAVSDLGTGITWSAQSGWFDLGNAQRPKLLHRIFLNVEARAGANLTGTVVAAGPFDGTQVITYTPVTITWPTTVGQQGNETAQELIATIQPALRGYRFLLQLSDAGSTVGYEITGALADVTLEATTPG